MGGNLSVVLALADRLMVDESVEGTALDAFLAGVRPAARGDADVARRPLAIAPAVASFEGTG